MGITRKLERLMDSVKDTVRSFGKADPAKPAELAVDFEKAESGLVDIIVKDVPADCLLGLEGVLALYFKEPVDGRASLSETVRLHIADLRANPATRDQAAQLQEWCDSKGVVQKLDSIDTVSRSRPTSGDIPDVPDFLREWAGRRMDNQQSREHATVGRLNENSSLPATRSLADSIIDGLAILVILWCVGGLLWKTFFAGSSLLSRIQKGKPWQAHRAPSVAALLHGASPEVRPNSVTTFGPTASPGDDQRTSVAAERAALADVTCAADEIAAGKRPPSSMVASNDGGAGNPIEAGLQAGGAVDVIEVAREPTAIVGENPAGMLPTSPRTMPGRDADQDAGVGTVRQGAVSSAVGGVSDGERGRGVEGPAEGARHGGDALDRRLLDPRDERRAQR